MSDTTSPNAVDLSDDLVLSMRDSALQQLIWVRQYMMQLVESVPLELWHTIPAGMHSHVAWQVGHIAVAEYGLLLFRQRGRTPEDLELMPGWLRKQYGKGSDPAAIVESVREPAELLTRLSEIHDESLKTVSALTAATLREEIDMPYAVYPAKLGAVMFAPIHESIHAGQIGFIRRGLGLDPLR